MSLLDQVVGALAGGESGGSSALLIRGQAAMQRPANEPAQRRVANVLLISAPPRP